MGKRITEIVGSGGNKIYRGSGWSYLGNSGLSEKDILTRAYSRNEKVTPEVKQWLDSLSENDISALLSPYWVDEGSVLGVKDERFDNDALLKDLAEISQYINEAPKYELDIDAIDEQSQQTIDSEINEMLSRLDEDKARQTSLFENQLKESNAFHGQALSQLMSKDYQNNARITDTMQSEMSRSRRNALEAGASAGLRLAENINVTLSAQNRQAQQSLETSNNLAQLLLNQRQASAGIRGDYGSYMSNQTAQRNDITGGRAERVQGYKDSMIGSEQARHQQKMDTWEKSYDTKLDGNYLKDLYRGQLQKSQYN